MGQVVEVPLFDSFFGAGFYRCRDGGYVSLVTVWYRHLEWFLDAAGQQAWV